MTDATSTYEDGKPTSNIDSNDKIEAASKNKTAEPTADAGRRSVDARSAQIVAIHRAELQTAVDLATYVRFSYPIGIKILAIAGAAFLVMALVAMIILGIGYEWPLRAVAANVADGEARVASRAIFLFSLFAFIGSSCLTCSGFSAHNYSNNINSWYQRVSRSKT